MGSGKPRALDAFCSAGGTSRGLALAGFDVEGVDLVPQPRYPYPFHLGDALDFVKQHGHEYDLIVGGPPCHDHSSLRSRSGLDGTGELLARFRDLCIATGLPYVIENVARADMPGALVLCGSEFGLGARCRDGVWRQLRRHRQFECSEWLWGAGGCCHVGQPIGVHGGAGGQNTRGYQATAVEARQALGIDWMRKSELALAIPPIYTQFIGEQLAAVVGA